MVIASAAMATGIWALTAAPAACVLPSSGVVALVATVGLAPSALKLPRMYTGALVATVRPDTELTVGVRLLPE